MDTAAAKRVLTRDDIFRLGAAPKVEAVEVPEWDRTVYIRAMSCTQWDAWAKGVRQDPDTNLRARIIAATCCDESGELIFSPGDVEAIGRMDRMAMERLVEVANRLNTPPEEPKATDAEA